MEILNKRKAQGLVLQVVALSLIALYTYLMFWAPEATRAKAMAYTVYAFVLILLSMLYYLGWIIFKTPTLKPEEVYELLNKKKRA